MSICLNMIVKNESKIIRRLLDSVYPFANSLCICDTGSTDNTLEIINDFVKEKNIRNFIIYHEPFQNFEYNRTHSLHKCLELQNLPDYILLLDADMVLEFNKDMNKEHFRLELCNKPNRASAFFLFQGNDNFYYKNIRLLCIDSCDRKKGDIPSYKGVTHEYVNIPSEQSKNGLIEIYKELIFIRDVGDGGSKDDKFQRDIKLLSDGLIAEPNNSRYMYYLANSYKDIGQHEKAIEYYKKNIEMNGWVEERWQSYYQIGHMCMSSGKEDQAIHYWLQAYELIPDRLENIYEIIKYYRITSRHKLAYFFYNLIHNSPSLKNTPSFLFLEKDVYEYKIYYEFSILGYYYNPNKYNIQDVSMYVLANPLVNDAIYNNMLSNYRFIVKPITTIAPKEINMIDIKNLHTLNTTSIATKYEVDGQIMNSSSPSFIFHENKLYVSVRKVNYKINEDGSYAQNRNITTLNIILEYDISTPVWKLLTERELIYDKKYDDFYRGIEDLRLCKSSSGQILYNGTRVLDFHTKIFIETGELEPNGIIMVNNEDGVSGKIIENSVYVKNNGFLLFPEHQQVCEKNWVLFIDASGKTKVIYNWNKNNNIIIGEFEKTIFQKEDPNIPRILVKETHKIPVCKKILKHTRGSTNGVTVNGEIWFICHVVFYGSKPTSYYHYFVTIDPETYIVKWTSKLFKFTKKNVEYCIGLDYCNTNNKFLIGYSVFDSTTKYMFWSIEQIKEELSWSWNS
jgi:tetratricopeptide (TPR) repeat protein